MNSYKRTFPYLIVEGSRIKCTRIEIIKIEIILKLGEGILRAFPYENYYMN